MAFIFLKIIRRRESIKASVRFLFNPLYSERMDDRSRTPGPPAADLSTLGVVSKKQGSAGCCKSQNRSTEGSKSPG